MSKKVFNNFTRLKNYLNIQPINTGQEINIGGIVSDDLEHLHAIGSVSGECIHLMSGVEFPINEYRGQNQEFTPCLSSLDRITKDHELFSALCRSEYFEQALTHHPVIKNAQGYRFSPDRVDWHLPLCINLQGIGQHYGLETEYLDITNNFSVASFFATQRWNNKTKKFEPMRAAKLPGVIYKLMPTFLLNEGLDGQPLSYVPVGWQPFPRPEKQRANAIHLNPREDFIKKRGIASFYFHHSYNQSKRIYEEFEGGEALIPVDALSDFAENLMAKTCFPESTIKKAFQRYRSRKKLPNTVRNCTDIMIEAGITQEPKDSFETLNWAFSKQEFENELQRLNKRIRWRLASCARS